MKNVLFADRSANHLAKLVRIRKRDVRQQDRKLFAAVTCRQFAGAPRLSGQHPADGA